MIEEIRIRRKEKLAANGLIDLCFLACKDIQSCEWPFAVLNLASCSLDANELFLFKLGLCIQL
jgi:hypothetical protein